MASKNLIIVADYKGQAYFLQMRNVVNWFFHNNNCKTFKSIDSAKKAAHRVNSRFKCDSVNVIDAEGLDCITCSSIRKELVSSRNLFSIKNQSV